MTKLALFRSFATLPIMSAAIVLTCLAETKAAPEEVSAADSRIQQQRDDAAGRLRVLVDGKEAFVYCYGPAVDMPYYYPVRSQGGKSMTVEHPNPYPHHRSVWFADKVRLAGQRDATFYAGLYTRKDKNDPNSPCVDRIRHVEFLEGRSSQNSAEINTAAVWEMDENRGVLDERRSMRVVALKDGHYLLDLTFTLTASYGDVTFTSDAVHYAWPYVRMNKQFSVEGGGTITNSEGGVNQKGTNGKEARWIDYSNTVDDETAGLAIFSHPDNPQPHQWLTRDYGTFGPRRPNATSGKPFTLAKGKSITQRVGIFVHQGDVKSGLVAKAFDAYIKGKF